MTDDMKPQYQDDNVLMTKNEQTIKSTQHPAMCSHVTFTSTALSDSQLGIYCKKL